MSILRVSRHESLCIGYSQLPVVPYRFPKLGVGEEIGLWCLRGSSRGGTTKPGNTPCTTGAGSDSSTGMEG